MRLRTILTAGAAVAVVIGTAVVVAPSAAAATVNVTIDCSSDAQVNAAVGDTVVITMIGDCGDGGDGFGFVYNSNSAWPGTSESGFFGSASMVNASYAWDSWQYANDWGAYSDGSGTTQVTTTLMSTNGLGQALGKGSTLGSFGPTGSASPYLLIYGAGAGTPDKPIPMWVQAFARADKDAPCPDGWTASWDQWPNDGKGGFVCQRSIKSVG